MAKKDEREREREKEISLESTKCNQLLERRNKTCSKKREEKDVKTGCRWTILI